MGRRRASRRGYQRSSILTVGIAFGRASPGKPVFSIPGWRVRPCRDADMEFLRRLYRTAREAELAHTGWPPALKRAFCDQQFDAQHGDYLSRFVDGVFLIILNRTDPVGRLYLDLTGPALRLIDITLLPAWQGKGIGGAVLRQLQQMASAFPDGSVVLSVDPRNPRARTLYERHGFRVTGTDPARLSMCWRAGEPVGEDTGLPAGQPDIQGET